jgi:hypothetical protein
VTEAGSDPWAPSRTIGVLGGSHDATVDRAGVVAPRAAAWDLAWWIGADDRWRVPVSEAAVRQHLLEGMPVVQTSMRVPGGDAVHRIFGAPVPDVGEVAVIEITNESPAPFVAALVVRGAGAVELDGSVVCVDGRRALCTPRPPSRWAMAVDGTTEEIVVRGDASDAPFVPGRDRGARLVAAFLFPVAHRTTLRAIVALGPRGVGRAQWAELPDAAAAARGWQVQLDRGMRVDLPDEGLQRAIETARAASVLAGQAGKPDPEVVLALEDWGFDPEAAAAWARLGGRQRRRLARRRSAPGSWADAWARIDRPDARLLARVRAAVVGDHDGAIELATDWPSDWIGLPVDVRDAPTRRGPVSWSVRWHGDRPALLWDGPGDVRFTAPGLDATWSSTEARGEALLRATSLRS